MIATLAAALAAALVTGLALAKGASEATITGPGLDDPITLAGEGQVGGEKLMQLAEAAGFFQAVFGQIPNTMLPGKPEGTLGSKYTITYVMPGPNNEVDEIVQDIYPYAQPDAVTYMAPGQTFFTTERTLGGWYVAGSLFKDQLVAVGLPSSPPIVDDDGGGGGTPWALIGVLAGAVVLLIAAAAAFRRRTHRSPSEMPAAQ